MKTPKGLISIYKAYNVIDAELIRGYLAAEGIESFLKTDDAGGTLSYFTQAHGIAIIIRKEDEEKAAEIIQKSLA